VLHHVSAEEPLLSELVDRRDERRQQREQAGAERNRAQAVVPLMTAF
jgi:hypothetical protein